MTTATPAQHAPNHKELRRQRRQARWRQWRRSWRVFRANKIAMLGLIIIVVFALVPVVYALLRQTAWSGRTYDPVTGYDMNIFFHPSPPSWLPPDSLPETSQNRFDMERPSFAHILGTDTLGRDVFSVLAASTVNSFLVGITAAVITAVISITLASLAVYYRGGVDLLLSHVADAFLLIPAPIFMIAVGAFLRAQNTTLIEMAYQAITGETFDKSVQMILQPLEFGFIYGVIAGAGGAMIVLRSHGLKVMTFSFVEASRVSGAGAWDIIWHHIAPHLMPLASVFMMVTVTGAVIADGFLSFTGYNPNPLSWGTMVYNAIVYRAVNVTIPWNALLAPALAISLFAAAFYMVSRGIQQVVEPRMREDLHLEDED